MASDTQVFGSNGDGAHGVGVASDGIGSGTSKVLVFGSGNFGSCLADHLSDVGNTVYLYSRSPEVVASFNTDHKNPKYLTDHVFSANLIAIGPKLPDGEFVRGVGVIIFAVPTQGLGALLKSLKPLFDPSNLPLLVFVNKGIETGTNRLPLEIIAENCGKEVARASTFLSGPSFAKEIIKRQPTQVSVSSLSPTHASLTAKLFHQPHFRCYINGDPIGVEVAGAVKNVYAIGSGCATGLGFESNTRAGLVTRCLAEMTRIGVAMGADPLTFLSLAGVGDLFLTCSSEKSRNFTVGYRLGKGEKLQDILGSLGSVAEGVETAKGVYEIVTSLQVHAPIAVEIYNLLHKGVEAKEVAERLMNLPPAVEISLSDHERTNGKGGGGGGGGEAGEGEGVGGARGRMLELRRKLGLVDDDE